MPLALAALAPAAAAVDPTPVTGPFQEAVALAQGVVVLAGDTANDGLGTAAAAPGSVMPTVWHHYDNAERVPRAVGDFVTDRTTRLADLDGPILQDFAATVAPHLEALEGAVRVDLELHAPIGGLPSGGVTPTVDYTIGDATAAAADGQGWLVRSAATAQAWAEEEAAAAQAFPGELVAILTG